MAMALYHVSLSTRLRQEDLEFAASLGYIYITEAGCGDIYMYSSCLSTCKTGKSLKSEASEGSIARVSQNK